MTSLDPALLLFSDRPHTAPVSWSKFRHIIVFGDSYSSDTESNWLGCLQKCISSLEGPPCIHNFAGAGDRVEDHLSPQLGRLFRKFPTAESLENSDSAIFVFWMGINDCGHTVADELEPIVEQLFDAMHELYVKWKARSFLLINLPPMQRSPVGLLINLSAERYDEWNEQLLEKATMFANSASKASVYVVSAHRIISDILDHPEEFGLSNRPRGRRSSNDSDMPTIWEDHLHLTSAVHRVFADRLLKVFDCK